MAEAYRYAKLGTEWHKFPATFTDAQISAALGAIPAANAASVPKARTWIDTAKDVAIGVGKGAARTALDAGSLVQAIPGVKTAVDAVYGQPGLSEASFKEARKDTEYTNAPQMVGGGLEMAAELAVPVGKAVEAVPTVAKAGQKFQSVMAAAKNIPVDVNGPGQVAMRIQQLAERGGSMPMAVRKFLNRITDPKLADMTYEEARDFASNISRLSANEYGRLTPAVGREVAELRVALNKAVGQAAAKAGKMTEYEAAMREYANAMKVRNAIHEVASGVKRVLPWASGAAAGTWLGHKLAGMLPSGE